MSVNGIEALGFTPSAVPQLSADQLGAVVSPTGPQATSGATATSGPSPEFGHLLTDGIDRLEAVQDHADQLAVQAATGDLSSIHDYTIAATEASVTTQLTVAVRNRALEAFNEIMRMPV